MLPNSEEIARAVSVIRRMRGVDKSDGFPSDLGCVTQLYLGLAFLSVRPRSSSQDIATVCSVNVPDAIFFGELCLSAFGSDWIDHRITCAASDALFGRGRLASGALEKAIRSKAAAMDRRNAKKARPAT